MSFEHDDQFTAHRIKRVEPSAPGDEPGWFLTFAAFTY